MFTIHLLNVICQCVYLYGVLCLTWDQPKIADLGTKQILAQNLNGLNVEVRKHQIKSQKSIALDLNRMPDKLSYM